MTKQTAPRPRKSRTKHYTAQGLIALGAIGLGVWGVMLSVGGDAKAQAGPEEAARQQAMDPAVYSHAQKLRRSVALTRTDLAAMDLTQAQGEAVLSRLATWCTANEQRLADAERAIHTAEREIRELNRRARTGEATPEELNDLLPKTQALKTAIETRQALLLEGGADAMQAGPSEARTAWQRVSELTGSLSDVTLRHLPTMDAERLEQMRSQAQQQGGDLADVMTYSEKQAHDIIRQRIALKRRSIAAAETKALPVPAALSDLGVMVEDEPAP